MHEYTPEAAQSIESESRQFTHRLMVDWNNNGRYNHPLSNMSQYVVRSSREQAISSTAPEELMLIEGHGSASLDIEVAGKFRNVPLTGHFAPYNGRSVFYAEGLSLGVSMYYDIAVWTDNGWEWYRQFTGTVKEVESIREQGTVLLHCFDNVERLRTGMSIHAFGIPYYLNPGAATPDPFLKGGYKRGALVDSSSIIDLAARSGGFTMGPKPGIANQDQNRQNILSVPFHGSILPEVGQMDEASTFHLTEAWKNTARDARAEAYIWGPHGYLALNGVPLDRKAWGVKKYWIDEGTSVGYGVTGTYTIGCWVKWDGAGTIDADCRVVTVNIQKSELRLIVRADGFVGGQVNHENNNVYTVANTEWISIPSAGPVEDPTWHYVEVSFQSQDGILRGRSRVNNTRSQTTTLVNQELKWGNNTLSGLVTINNWLAISDVEICRSTWYRDIENTSKDITPANTAVVDSGRNRITYTMRETEQPSWDIAKEVAAAEYGVIWFDEYGKFRFSNFDTVQKRGTEAVDRYLDLGDVEGLSMRTTMDSVRNKWVVTTRTGYSDVGIFYDLTEDGEPWGTPDNNGWPSPETELWPVRFNPQPHPQPNTVATSFYYLKAAPNLMCPYPWNITTLGENAEWTDRLPLHGKKVYQGSTYVGDTWPGGADEFSTEQKWVRRDLVRLAVSNPLDGAIGYWLNAKNEGRFRMRASLVYEDEPVTWTISTTDVANQPNQTGGQYADSIPRYGERVIELADNFWLQDEFQTRRMLEAIIKKFGRPIPVTDAITVPGDPRVQIGDVLEIRDDEGMGSNIRLQVYGITRELEDGVGLVDTYQVEVVENPGVGRWDDPNYGLWDTSLIWS